MDKLIKTIHDKARRMYTMKMPSPSFKLDVREAVTLYSNNQILKALEEIEETLLRWDSNIDTVERLPVELSRKIRELRNKAK